MLHELLLFNIHTKEWMRICLNFSRCRKNSSQGTAQRIQVWPDPRKSAHDGIPVCAILGDQQASLYGQGCVNSGDVKNTYGTGCFLMMNAGAKKPKTVSGLLTTLAADRNGNPVYAFEGAIFIAGAVVQWLRDELKIIKNADETEKLALSVSDTHGVVIIPAFAGLGSPYWRSDIRGAVSGITRGVSRAHFVRAALESISSSRRMF
jgi:glycerol kinase